MLAVLGLCTLVPGPARQRKQSPAWEEIWAELDVFLLSQCRVAILTPALCPGRQSIPHGAESFQHHCPHARLGGVFLPEDGQTPPGARGVLDHISKCLQNLIEKRKKRELNLLQVTRRQCRRDTTTVTDTATGSDKFPKEQSRYSCSN